MNKFKMIFVMMLRLLYTWKKIGFSIPSFNNKKSEWIIYEPSFFSPRELASDKLQKVVGAFYYLSKSGVSVSIYTKRNIGVFHDKNIVFFAGLKNECEFQDYSSINRYISENLIKQGNFVFPSLHEASLWENKDYMHKVFDEKNVRTPKSELVQFGIFLSGVYKNYQYPFLIKEIHSCSANGVHKIEDQGSIDNIVKNKIISNSQCVIIQELLNIRRDFRVILVDDEIVLHYWRINLSSDWKPTSTGHGSMVDFNNFPEKWRDWIINTFKSLEIRTGAFDIAWQDDNIEFEPYILEVSPFYQPNPKPPINLKNNYGDWKKSLTIRESYQKSFIDTMFEIQKTLVKSLLKENSQRIK